MRTAKWFADARWIFVPHVMTVALVLAMFQAVSAISLIHADEAVGEWMEVNENGEPREVTLADGTTLTLDTYDHEHDVTEWRPPIDAAEKGQTVFDYEKSGLAPGIGGHFLRLDVEGGRMYWIGNRSPGAG